MERRMRWKSHVRCEAGEKPETTSKAYLSLSYTKKYATNQRATSAIKKVISFVAAKLKELYPQVFRGIE